MEPEEQQSEKPANSYGKSSTGKKVAMYVVGAIVVYGLVYYLFLR